MTVREEEDDGFVSTGKWHAVFIISEAFVVCWKNIKGIITVIVVNR